VKDRGVLTLLDNRILKQRYGRIFLESLPPYRKTRDLADVEQFFNANNLTTDNTDDTDLL